MRVLLIILAMCSQAFTQWPNTPDNNLALCIANSEQAISKIVVREDGGSYVSWFDNRSGGYDVYMQSIDAEGNLLWQTDGILIADRNYSWTMDFGLTVDSIGNAIVVYRKDMLGGDGIVVSSVNQSGAINWHQTVQTGISYVASPVICSSGDSLFVGWIGNDDSRVQKLNNQGLVQWKLPTIMTDPDGGFYLISDIQPSLNGDAIASFVQYLSFSGNKRIKAQRIQSDGSLAWSTQTDVMTSNSLQYGNYPDFIPDGAGGGFFTWYGVNPLQCYATHVSSNGIKWFAGEVQVASSVGSTQRVEPVAVVDGNEYVVFFRSLDNSQNNDGLGSQRFTANGGLMWGNAGIELKPTSSSPQYGSLSAAKTNEGAILAFTQSPSFGNDVINAISIDQNGLPNWSTNFVSVASTPSSKSRIAMATTGDGVVLAWQDDRDGGNDIYGQRVNSDGSLGASSTCLADIDSDGSVGVSDLLRIIDAWGDCGIFVCDEDLDDDEFVGVSDLLIVIDAWGMCI